MCCDLVRSVTHSNPARDHRWQLIRPGAAGLMLLLSGIPLQAQLLTVTFLEDGDPTKPLEQERSLFAQSLLTSIESGTQEDRMRASETGFGPFSAQVRSQLPRTVLIPLISATARQTRTGYDPNELRFTANANLMTDGTVSGAASGSALAESIFRMTFEVQAQNDDEWRYRLEVPSFIAIAPDELGAQADLHISLLNDRGNTVASHFARAGDSPLSSALTGIVSEGTYTFEAIARTGFNEIEESSGGTALNFGAFLDVQPAETHLWSGRCNNSNWHQLCEGDTNWMDRSGATAMPPDDQGDEVAGIEQADVVISDRLVRLASLSSTGSLTVKQPLTLLQSSAIESLSLQSPLHIGGGRLTLSGTNTTSGDGHIMLANDAVLRLRAGSLVAAAPTSAQGRGIVEINNGDFVVDSDFTVGTRRSGGAAPAGTGAGSENTKFLLSGGKVKINENRTLLLAGASQWTDGEIDIAAGGQLRSEGHMTVGDAPIVGVHPRISRTVVTLDGSGGFFNLGVLVQDFDINLADPDGLIVNQKVPFIPESSTGQWHLNGNLRIAESASGLAAFDNHGKLIKPIDQNASESQVDLFYSGEEGSEIDVRGGTLTLRGGGLFQGQRMILIAGRSELNLAAADGETADYLILKKLTTQRSTDFGPELGDKGVVKVSPRATLMVDNDVQFVNTVPLEIERGAALDVKGIIANSPDSRGRHGEVRQASSNVNISGSVLNSSNWCLFAGAKISGNGRFTNTGHLTLDGRQQPGAATIDLDFDNRGHVIVSHLGAPQPTTLQFTGDVPQREGSLLTGGFWEINDNGVLIFARPPGQKLKTIGTPLGDGEVEVRLWGGGKIMDMALEAVERTGRLDLRGTVLRAAGGFTLSGKLELRQDKVPTGSPDIAYATPTKLIVNGDFTQDGDVSFLHIHSREKAAPTHTPEIEVINGSMKLSHARVDGIITVATPGKKVTFGGGLRGTGQIAAKSVEFLVGQIEADRDPTIIIPPRGSGSGDPDSTEPDFLTFTNDYLQGEQAVFSVQIAGSRLGHYGRLVVGGTAELEQGTGIQYRLVDPLDPENNPQPFVPAVGDVFDILTAGRVTDHGFTFSAAPDGIGLPAGLFFEPSIVDLAEGGQAIRLTTMILDITADFDADGDVDDDDFLAWQRGLGTTAGAMRSDGDTNANGNVDGNDFLNWQRLFGSGVEVQPRDVSMAVPEPTTMAMFILIISVCSTSLGRSYQRRVDRSAES